MRDLRVFNDTVHSRFLGSLGGDWSRLPSLDAVVWMLMLSTMSGSAMRSASSSSGFMEGGDGGGLVTLSAHARGRVLCTGDVASKRGESAGLIVPGINTAASGDNSL